MAYKQHHVWNLVPAWGHITSAHALIARMLQLNPSLVVTMVTHAMIKTKVEADLALFSHLPRERLHIVFAGDEEYIPNGTWYIIQADEHESILKTHGMQNAMPVALQQLTSTIFSTLEHMSSTPNESNWPTPTAVIVDPYGGNMLRPRIREMLGPKTKILGHFSQAASCIYSMMAPFSAGGINDLEDVVDKIYNDEGRRNGRKKEEIRDAVVTCKNGSDDFNGTVIRVPGLGPMYDYEREAMNITNPPAMLAMLPQFAELSTAGDGAVVCSSLAIEGPAIEAMKKYTKIHAVGITIAPNGWDKVLSIKDADVKAFLDKHSQNDVVYVSFGSHFFPPGPLVHILLSVLRTLKIPFLFCLGGGQAQGVIDASLISEINSSGDGWVINGWSEQKAILQHEAVGWYIAHGGWNGTCESVVAGVPLIYWPLMMSDQSVVAANLSLRQKGPVAFELLQIRQGYARGPPMRGAGPISGDDESVRKEFEDVLTRARGPQGEKMRKNVEALARELRAERSGRADEAIKELASV